MGKQMQISKDTASAHSPLQKLILASIGQN